MGGALRDVQEVGGISKSKNSLGLSSEHHLCPSPLIEVAKFHLCVLPSPSLLPQGPSPARSLSPSTRTLQRRSPWLFLARGGGLSVSPPLGGGDMARCLSFLGPGSGLPSQGPDLAWAVLSPAPALAAQAATSFWM